MKISNEDIEKRAIKLVQSEVKDWDSGLVFVTESIAFEMRNFIRQFRKNYWQVFNKPLDPITGRKKIFPPLTRTLVDGWFKNTPIDQKDINYKAKKANRRTLAKVVRGYSNKELTDMGFSEELDLSRRQLAIDGTFVWKFIKNGKKITTKFIDLLNCYIDPSAKSINDTEAFIERDPMSMSEFDSEGGVNGWVNMDKAQGSTDVSEVDSGVSSSQSKQIPKIEIFRREGLTPISLITGIEPKEGEREEQIMARIIISDTKGQSPQVHNIEKMTEKDGNGDIIKSYEEAWADRIPGRWYGVGPAEKVVMMQLYLNHVYNTRISRNSVSSLGIFKIRRNSGIKPQDVARMVSNGVIKVKQMDDIMDMPMQEASAQSYNEENNIFGWGQRVAGLPDIALGDAGAATQTATVGAITARSSASTFIEIQKALGKFIERGLKRHLMPSWKKNIKKGDIVRLTLNTEELAEFDKEIMDMASQQLIDDKTKEGIQFISIEEVQLAQQQAVEMVKAGNDERFKEILDDIDITDFDVEVYVKSDKLDKNILVTDLINFSRVAPEFRMQVAKELNDILGINMNVAEVEKQIEAQQQAQQAQTSQVEQPRTEEERMTGTNTRQGQGISV